MVKEVNSLKVIEKVVSKIVPGSAPSFTKVHVIKALEMVGARETVGRKRLSKWLGLGEGTVRTLIKHLKIVGLIKTSRSGVALSKFGKKVLSDLRSRITGGIDIPDSSLTIGPSNVAVLVRNVSDVVRYGIEQRDAAIKVGALGATTLIFRRNKLTMPGVSGGVFEEIPFIYNILLAKLKARENDVIIIGSANEKRLAEFGAKAAAFELLKN